MAGRTPDREEFDLVYLYLFRNSVAVECLYAEPVFCSGIETAERVLALAIDKPVAVQLVGSNSPAYVVALCSGNRVPAQMGFLTVCAKFEP